MTLDHEGTLYCKSAGSQAWWDNGQLLTFSIFGGPVYNFTTELLAKKGMGTVAALLWPQ